MLIVDVDAHHYENENFHEFIPYMENDVLRQLAMQSVAKSRGGIMPTNVGYQDMGGRVTRYPMRGSEKTEEKGHLRDVQLGHRWMDAMSVDYSCLFPTGMLNIGMHPQKEMEAELCWAYNRWLTEEVMPNATTASSRCSACHSTTLTRRCARSKPSGIASTSAASWSRRCATPACRKTST